MMGTWILLLILLSSALPAIIVFIWLKVSNSPVTLLWMLASLVAGILSFIGAALIQSFFTLASQYSFGTMLFDIFIRIAMLEEASRIITLVLLLIAASKLEDLDWNIGATLGLIAGLGFALIESAYHGLSDINITMLRAFTAAPLHGACGIRTGAAVFTFGSNKGKSVFYFLSAVIIHGAYNMAIISPAIPSALAILIAITAFLASLTYIKRDT